MGGLIKIFIMKRVGPNVLDGVQDNYQKSL